MSAGTAGFLLLGALPVCLWVIYSDLSRMRIPNKAVLALALVWVLGGLVAVAAGGMSLEHWAKGCGLGLVGLAVSFVGINLKAVPGLVRILAIAVAFAPVLLLAVAPAGAGLSAGAWVSWVLTGWVICLATVYSAFVGGGDSKFVAAMAPFFVGAGGMQIMAIVLPTFLAAFAAHRLCRAVPAIRDRVPHWVSWTAPDKKFPMGLALAGSLIFFLSAQVLPLF